MIRVVTDTGPLLHLTEARAALLRLASSSLWISRRIVAEAHTALDEIFRGAAN